MDTEIRLCRGCNYDLTGLGTKGSCPECGQYYDVFTREGVRSGRSERHRRGDRLAARIRTILLALATVLVLSCGVFAAFIVDEPARPLWIAGVIAFVGIMATITSYVYEWD